MEYHITIGDQQRLVISALHTPDNTFKVIARDIDLSQVNLFQDPSRAPDRTGAEHSLFPLAREIKGAFSSLQDLNSSSPLVSALKEFGSHRVEHLLASIESSQAPSPISLRGLPENQQHQADTLLRRITRRIDQELPHFFRTEKTLGSFDWLRSGGKKTLFAL